MQQKQPVRGYIINKYQHYILTQHILIHSSNPLSKAEYYLKIAQANSSNPIKFNKYFAYSSICLAKVTRTSQAWSQAAIASAKAGNQKWANYCYSKLQHINPQAIRHVRWQVILTSVQTNNANMLTEEISKFSSNIWDRLWYIFFASAKLNSQYGLNVCAYWCSVLDPSGTAFSQYINHFHAYCSRQTMNSSQQQPVNPNQQQQVSSNQRNTVQSVTRVANNRQKFFPVSKAFLNYQQARKRQASQNPRLG